MSKVVLTLETPAGPFVFLGAEVPEHIATGGRHMLSVHRLIGGKRIVNALGPDESAIAFSGIFAYEGTARSDFLDSLRQRGDVCTLTWDNRRYLVIVAQYQSVYHKPYLLEYSIGLLVVSNEMALVDAVPPVTPTQQLRADLNTVSARAGCLGNSTLAGIASSVSSAMDSMEAALRPMANGLKAVSTVVGDMAQCADQVANAIETATAAVAAPVAQLLANTQALISNSEAAISEAVSFGGIVPGNPVAQSVGTYMSQLNTMNELPALYEISNVSQRMQLNLANAGPTATAKTVTVGGGTLYDVAASQYGDATKWTDIATANGLSDPMLSGINTLTIPAA